MPEPECPDTRRAELFVRGSLPTPSRERLSAVETQLQELERDGLFDETTTTRWRKRVPIDGEECPEHRRYNEFADWARDEGVRLAPFFSTRECYSFSTGERRTELVMPVMCLAVYEDGDLARVAPFADAGGPTSVEACLERLAARTTAQAGTITLSTAD